MAEIDALKRYLNTRRDFTRAIREETAAGTVTRERIVEYRKNLFDMSVYLRSVSLDKALEDAVRADKADAQFSLPVWLGSVAADVDAAVAIVDAMPVRASYRARQTTALQGNAQTLFNTLTY